jgi:uracil-DNA glycosylase
MTRREPSSAGRTVKAVRQRLKSLERAGVTHVARRASKAARPAEASSPAEELAPPVAACPAAAADDRAVALAQIARRVSVCLRCKELARTRTQTVFGDGNPNARLVFMGEAPGADEDRQGKPFVGRAGQLLTDIIEKGMKIPRAEVYILNTLKCRPPENRTPAPDEVANCREYLEGQLAILQPEFICCLGAVAAQSLLETTVSIGKLRGRLHDFHGIKVLCTYHPAYLLRNPDAKRLVWDDLKLLIAEMGKR